MERFSIKKRIRSFGYAFSGLKTLFREEHNAWIHASATVLVIFAGFLLRISETEWIAVTAAIGMVIAAEAFNSSIERLADVVQPERDGRIKGVKDLAAGAVLACAIAAAVIGLIIFLPKLINLF
jgi:diacylglycerol kinase (ATP)